MGTDQDRDTNNAANYGINATLRIRKHLPPYLFTGSDWDESDRVEFALANPPFETEPPGTVERVLTVTGSKTIRDDGGPQVVTCFLDGDPSTQYVAKIYDGAKYPLSDPYSSGRGYNDCMSYADRDYNIEAWAYRTMQPAIGGTFVPAYHGSWTFPAGK
ncbi:hypothetical protein C8A05DRAFT_30634 [Staphylotrichum tortipilum]|uniref:Uncharacterized protein n=1 Tax=Staphylotrichum tortipilum TaxID=2831512 RepID=A0AAN6RWQ6_9PEZI|nr:hypothetical protein C8A05DRAFT_30634 [Staphylotrichum longicolle]